MYVPMTLSTNLWTPFLGARAPRTSHDRAGELHNFNKARVQHTAGIMNAIVMVIKVVYMT